VGCGGRGVGEGVQAVCPTRVSNTGRSSAGVFYFLVDKYVFHYHPLRPANGAVPKVRVWRADLVRERARTGARPGARVCMCWGGTSEGHAGLLFVILVRRARNSLRHTVLLVVARQQVQKGIGAFGGVGRVLRQGEWCGGGDKGEQRAGVKHGAWVAGSCQCVKIPRL